VGFSLYSTTKVKYIQFIDWIGVQFDKYACTLPNLSIRQFYVTTPYLSSEIAPVELVEPS